MIKALLYPPHQALFEIPETTQKDPTNPKPVRHLSASFERMLLSIIEATFLTWHFVFAFRVPRKRWEVLGSGHSIDLFGATLFSVVLTGS